MSKYGLIAGNGRFPLLALETARKMGDEVVAVAIREEASPEVEASRRAAIGSRSANSAGSSKFSKPRASPKS